MPTKKQTPKPKPPKRPRKTHDWAKLETDYYQSEFLSVSEFLRSVKVLKDGEGVSGPYSKATAGWRDKKIRLASEMLQNVQTEMRVQGAKVLKEMDKTLVSLGQAIFPSVARYMARTDKEGKSIGLTPHEAQVLFNMLMVRLGLPTDITRQEMLAAPELEDDDFAQMTKDLDNAIPGHKKTG